MFIQKWDIRVYVRAQELCEQGGGLRLVLFPYSILHSSLESYNMVSVAVKHREKKKERKRKRKTIYERLRQWHKTKLFILFPFAQVPTQLRFITFYFPTQSPKNPQVGANIWTL